MIFFGQASLQHAIGQFWTISKVIINASKTNTCGPTLSLRYRSRCIGASVWVDCSTISTG